MTKKRNEVAHQDCWDVEALYTSLEAWMQDFEASKDLSPLSKYRGTLGEGPAAVQNSLETILKLSRALEKLYVWAHLRHDEEITQTEHKEAFSSIASLLHDLKRNTAWFEPELLALPEKTLQNYLQAPELRDYKFFLEKIIRQKPHILPKEQEELLALVGKALQTPPKAFAAMNNADFKFGTVLDSAGKSRELTHASYGLFIRDQDRVLRENAFKGLHGKFLEFQNTLCELLNGRVQEHVFNARARHYPTSLDAALFSKDISPKVYHSLIQTVHDNIHVLHDYMKLRKQLLGIEELHVWDLYVPLTDQVDIQMDYLEAEKLVVQSVAALGNEYQQTLREGLTKDRWVDRYENENKRSGAYSSGCYDSMPYILMNYKGILNDVFTLAHEAGHSMHSFLSRKHQPYQYCDYTIFEAEVASTFNEELLNRTLMEHLQTREEKIFLLTQQIEGIRTTFFRQTMFAEFELMLHEWAEKDRPLTPQLLKEEYHKLNQFYFGPHVVLDSPIEIEWARIPHFYYNFYVFQYATGISAAMALADKVLQGADQERDAYLTMLKSGGSKFPIELLRTAGIDMSAPQPIQATINKFADLLEQLKSLCRETSERKT